MSQFVNIQDSFRLLQNIYTILLVNMPQLFSF